MTRALIVALAVIAVGGTCPPTLATTIRPVEIKQLFKEADLVAEVRVVSGNAEHYSTAVYKAVVLTAFKGAVANETIYFGPFVGFRVGWEYLLFLKRSREAVWPTGATLVGTYGVLNSFYRVMYDGYSSMELDYACVFDTKNGAQGCDNGVILNPEQVLLPQTLTSHPRGEATALTNWKKWVRKKELFSFLEHASK